MIVYANLDQEARWSGATLPRRVRERIAATAALVAALAPREDEHVELWAPAEVAAEVVLGCEGFAAPVIRAGVPARWDLAWADPAARAVNDRRFGLGVARELGVALPGARAVASLAELDAAIARLAGAWVAKAPWTAAGRDRARGDDAALAGEIRVFAERLLARFGALVVEPWLPRIADVATCAEVTAGGAVHARAPHALVVDARGGFGGIDLHGAALEPDERDELARVVAGAGAALARAGYLGPFGVDAFVWRDAAGARRLHPLCELNARYTFGHVAHALAARTGATRLGFGQPPAGARVLVAAPSVAAWIA